MCWIHHHPSLEHLHHHQLLCLLTITNLVHVSFLCFTPPCSWTISYGSFSSSWALSSIFFFTNLCPLILGIITSASLALDSLILWTFTWFSNQVLPSSALNISGSSASSWFWAFLASLFSCYLSPPYLWWLRISSNSHSFLDLLWSPPWFSFFLFHVSLLETTLSCSCLPLGDSFSSWRLLLLFITNRNSFSHCFLLTFTVARSDSLLASSLVQLLVGDAH